MTAVLDTYGNELGGSDVPNPFSFTALITGVEGGPAPASQLFRIGGVRPNPVRAGQSPVMEIGLDKAGPVTVQIYNALGQLAGPAVDQVTAAGRHNFSLKTSELAPGVYFVRVRAGASAAVRKFTVVR